MKFGKGIGAIAKAFQSAQLWLRLEGEAQTIGLTVSGDKRGRQQATEKCIGVELSREGKSLSTQFFLLSREHPSKVRLTADRPKIEEVEHENISS